MISKILHTLIRSRLTRGFSALSILLISATRAYAQPPSGTPGGFAGFASNFTNKDLSLELVDILFGPVWQPMVAGGINTGIGGSGELLGALSMVLNAAALAIVSVFIVFTVVTSILHTGNDGEVLGKKYSTLFVPIRVFIALVMLVPVAGGYSMAQAGVMLVGKAGAGVANAVFETGTTYLVTSNFDVGLRIGNDVESLGGAVLQTLVCTKKYNALTQNRIEQHSFNTIGSDGAGRRTVSFDYYDSGWDAFGPDPTLPTPAAGGAYFDVDEYYQMAACGMYSLEFDLDAQSVQSDLVRAIIQSASGGGSVIDQWRYQYKTALWNAFGQLVSDLNPIATQIANKQTPSYSAYHDALVQFRQTLRSSAQSLVNTVDSQISAQAGANGQATGGGPIFQTVINKLNQLGWAGAGAFYWTLSSLRSQVNSIFSATMTSSGPNMKFLKTNNTEIFEGYYSSAITSIARAQKFSLRALNDPSVTGVSATTVMASGAPENAGDAFSDLLSQANGFWNVDQATTTWISDQIAEDGRPIATGQTIGHWVIGIAESLYFFYITASATAEASADSLVGQFLPVWSASSNFVEGLIDALAPLLFLSFITLLLLGLMLAYWLPALPMIIWVFGILSWIIILIEAVFAAILWAAAHAIPEGDGWAGNHARAGYMLILGLFMRPALMVVGFFAAMLVMTVVGVLVSTLFPIMLVTADISSFVGFVGLIAALAILTTLYIVSADRAFSLIHHLPNKVLRWVSGPTEMLNDEQDAQRSKQSVVGIAGRFEGAGKQLGRDTGRRMMPKSGSGSSGGRSNDQYLPG